MIGRFAILLPYFRKQKVRLLAILLATGMLAGVSVLYPWPIKILIDHALGDAVGPWDLSDSTLVLLAASAVLALYVVGAAFDVLLSWLWMACGQRMVYDLMVDVLQHLLRVPLGREKCKVGDSLERLSNDTWCVYTVASDMLISPVQQMLTLVGIVVVAMQVNVTLTVVSLVSAPAIAYSVHWFGPRLKLRAKHGRESRAELTSFVHQTLTSLPLIQSQWMQAHHQQQYHRLADQVVVASQRGVLVNKTFSLMNGVLTETGRALVLVVGGSAVLNGSMTVGTLVLFMSYVKTMQKAVEKLLKTFAQLKTIEASLDRLHEVVSQPQWNRPSTASRGGEEPVGGAALLLDDVAFEYRAGERALGDINLQIAAGERIGIVGESGAGKSTLISLVASLAEPTRGRIYLGGVDLQDMPLPAARQQVALLLQEPFLLPITIAENIGIGKPEATRAEIEQAAKLARAEGFVRELPDGYDTVLGERGLSLSVGQQQRIAIARAFLKDAPVIVLDEPTAALDAASEMALVSALSRLTAGKTTIVVSHRLSTLQGVDRIVVLDQGKLVEQGPPAELLAKRGFYHRLFTAQQPRSIAEACP